MNHNSSTIILLTGASAGIGRTTAILLARHGFCVFGTSRHPDRMKEIPGVTLLPLDINDTKSIQICIQTVMDRAGRIDVLVNNAGLIGPSGASEETDIEQVRELLDTNFLGVVQITNAVLPIMRRQRAGKIINISSVGGQISAPPYFAFYAAAKHALEGYSEGLRYEVRRFNIHVAMVEPGYTRTDIGSSIHGPRIPIQAYAATREPLVLLDLAGIRYGTPPEATAREVMKLIRHPRPPLRSSVGTDSFAILLLRQWLPYDLFERLIEWMFYSWKPPREIKGIPRPNELGLHRLFFHQPTRDWSLRAAVLTLCAIVGMGTAAGLLRLKRRRS